MSPDRLRRRVRAVGRAFREALAESLVRAKDPRSRIFAEEAAAAVRYRHDEIFRTFTRRPAWAGDLHGELSVVPTPAGTCTSLARRILECMPIARSVTVAGIFGADSFAARVAEVLPRARRCPLGRMQRPPFDGPVDLRDWSAGGRRAEHPGL